MLDKKMESALNKHMNAELYSSYLYFSMQAWLEGQGLKGMASWMRVQAKEEMAHGMKFYSYILERGGKVELTQIDGPTIAWETPLALFDNVCDHEALVTSLVNMLVDLAIAEKDHAANAFLQWFVEEQVEEEASAGEVRDRLNLAAGHAGALFMIDQELGSRIFTAPAGVVL